MKDEQPEVSSKRNAKLQTDLKKLRRVDLLELLVDQVREGEERAAAMAELERLSRRQQEQLEEKDRQIGLLVTQLGEKDARIVELQEQNDLYARTVDVLNIRELAKFQERATMEYLALVAEKNG